MSDPWLPLSVGPEVVKRLIAHRPPLMMIDRLVAVRLGDTPALRTARFLTANEPYFAGHFPGLGLMPGVLSLEGLAQSAEALAVVLHLTETLGADTAIAELLNLERGATFDPRHDAARAEAFLAASASRPRPITVAGSASAKFHRPIFPGCRLDFEVSITRRVEALTHFALEASVDGEPAVTGTFSTARIAESAWPLGR